MWVGISFPPPPRGGGAEPARWRGRRATRGGAGARHDPRPPEAGAPFDPKLRFGPLPPQAGAERIRPLPEKNWDRYIFFRISPSETLGLNVSVPFFPEYDLSARQTIQHGRSFAYRDRWTGELRRGYLDSRGRFTATSQNGGRTTIHTHFRPQNQNPLSYVRNLRSSTW